MKKYITIAALLAAGGLSANATTYHGNVNFDALDLLLQEKGYVGQGAFSFDFTFTGMDIAKGYDSAEILNLGTTGYYLGTQQARYIAVSNAEGDDLGAVNNIRYTDYTGDLTSGWVWDSGSQGGVYNQKYSISYDGISTLTIDVASQKTLVFTNVTNLDAREFDLGEKVTGASVSNLVAVPEPSAFGLLAGVGALALVASRRRRR
ncbi:MAG: PEP-CTERM sorting domain-containing protein [Verrucomicrobia bacterium]|nr:PEP-CTERM sorting domain-containing protein [Verrucomicrobiota bacterium]